VLVAAAVSVAFVSVEEARNRCPSYLKYLVVLEDVELVRLAQLLIDVALERSVSFTGAWKIASGDYYACLSLKEMRYP
jgi:hypothetical protein